MLSIGFLLLFFRSKQTLHSGVDMYIHEDEHYVVRGEEGREGWGAGVRTSQP